MLSCICSRSKSSLSPPPSTSSLGHKVLCWAAAFFVLLSALALSYSFLSACPLPRRHLLRMGGIIGGGISSLALGLLLWLPQPRMLPKRQEQTTLRDSTKPHPSSDLGQKQTSLKEENLPVGFKMDTTRITHTPNWQGSQPSQLRHGESWEGWIEFLLSDKKEQDDIPFNITWASASLNRIAFYSFPVRVTKKDSDFYLAFTDKENNKPFITKGSPYSQEEIKQKIQTLLCGKL